MNFRRHKLRFARNSPADPEVQFADRRQAGRYLATKLDHYRNRTDVLVLALPRGGVPVAFEVAQALRASLDIFVVRKLGAPIFEELAIGAIATGGTQVLNHDIIQRLGITPAVIEAVVREEAQELHRREHLYRGDRPPVSVREKAVILVDDGLATGATMRAAVKALQLMAPKSICVAVPIAAVEACQQLAQEAEVICAKTPEPFVAVGRWYADFTQTTDEEVQGLLNRAAHDRRVQQTWEEKGTDTPHQEEIGSIAAPKP